MPFKLNVLKKNTNIRYYKMNNWLKRLSKKGLTDLRATENLLNRNSKTFSEGCRTKEPSDPESTLRLGE